MKNAIIIISISALVTVFEALMVYFHHKDIKKEKNYVGLPIMYLYIGCFFLLISLFPLIAEAINGSIFSSPVCWLFFAMDFLMILMCLNQVNWRIVPMKNEMIYRNFLRIEITISYDSIKKVKRLKTEDTLIFLQGTRLPIVIDKFAFGMEDLMRSYNFYILKNR